MLLREVWVANRRPGDPGKTTIHKLGGWIKVRGIAVKQTKLKARDLEPPPIEYTPPICEDLDDDLPTNPSLDPPCFDPSFSAWAVITYAQNATPLEDNFWASLMQFCAYNGATLHVIKGRYKNPTSLWSCNNENDDWWDPRIAQFELKGRTSLCGQLTVYGDVCIHPTAVRPLTGFEVFTGKAGGIFGHPKLQLVSVAAGANRQARILTTTGAATLQNYTDSKAGKKGEAHHVFGAVVVHTVGDKFTLRHINATADGCFIDLDKFYSPYGVEQANRPAALVLGDIHHARLDEEVVRMSLTDEESIARVLRPRQVIYHDLLDFRARNHHRIKNPDALFESAMGGEPNIVEDEVLAAIRFVDESTPPDAIPVVVASNHDEAFDRWLRDGDPNNDPLNSRFFHETRALKLRHYEEHQEWVPALELLYTQRGAGRATLLRRDQNYMVGGIECGYHGDVGVGGSKGSLLQYAKLGVKSIVGHGHCASILDGCYQVGITGDLDQSYNRTPSNWMHAHCLIYDNFKRTLIFVQEGFWR